MGKKILAVLLSTALLFCAFRFDVVDVHAADNDTNEEIAEEIVETTLASEDTIDLSEEPIEIEIENEHETDEEPATDTAGDTADVGPVISMPENDESIVDIPEEEVIDTSTNDVSENEVLEIPSEPKAFCDVQRKGSVEIIIDAPAGVFPEGTIAIITELTDAGTVKSIEEAVSEELSDTQTITEIKAYDITMFDANGHEVQPDLSFGSVSVTFKNIDTLEALNDASKDIEVFHVEDSFNNAESMDASVSVQEVSFEAEHFSTYAVVSIEDNTADSSKVIDDKVLLKSMNVTVVDSKGNSKPLSATGDKISLSDTIHVEYIFNEPLVINPVNSKIDGYHVKAGEHYKLPSIPKVCAKPSGFSIDVKSADKKLGVITFDSDGNAVLEIDSSFGEMVEAKKALAGFDLSLNLNKADNGDKEEYELEFGDNKYTVKVSDFMAQPPKVTKSASTIDADGNVTWTVTVTNDAKPIDYADGYTIKDTFSEGQSYVLDSLKVVGGEAITPTASGSSITWNYKDNTASKATQFEYKTHIDFVALTKDENKNATVSKEISNNVEVTAPKGTDYDPLSISYKAKSTVSKAVDKWIDKSCTPVDENGKATWTIVIKNNGFTFKNVVLHDTIKADSGVEITMGPVTVVDAGGNNVAFTEKTTSKSHDIKFTDNMAGDAVYTVTYETTIEDYDTYLKDNHSVPSNKAWLTYEYDAKGNGEWTGVVGPGIDVNFKGDGVMSKAAIEKTEAGIDRVNHTMDWLVEINNNKQSLTEVSVSDKIPDKHTFVEVKDVKIDGAAATEGSDYTVDSTDPKNIKVIFNDNVKKKKASFVITTQLDDSQNMIWASNAKAEYTNVATLSSAGNKDVSDDAKQEFVSEVIKKTAGDYNYNTHIIPYTITVNQNKMPMGKVIVKDPLDSRLEYVDGSSNVTDTVYDASKNTLTFTFDNLDDTQVITFNAKVKDGDTFLNNGEFTIENNASLVSDKYDKETKVLANTKIKNTVIAKKGSRNKEVINYTVELNVANQDLYRGGVEEVVIEDKIGASLVLDEDSVKLYEAAVSADGKLTKATLVDTAEKRFDYSTPKTIMQVVVPKSGANKAYILEYTAKMLKAKANDFSNNVVLKGYGDNSKNTSDVEYPYITFQA